MTTHKVSKMEKKPILILLLLASASIIAQKHQKLTSNQLYEKIQKLNFLGSAMYIAAHPDDENTRLIAYLANEKKARTAYLSLTRGDGGQNLIGSEMRELLGVIRTQELLAARGVDGGEQRFTRANDFGYSKHSDETFTIWDKEKILSDVVWAIRTFKPDVIINRFNHRTPGTTHGHHTASAMMSYEAFDLAGDSKKYPEQLTFVDTWQPKSLFYNLSWWSYGSREKFEKVDKSAWLTFDIGVYYPLKGVSNNELASIASSQHLCQGFGRLTVRGTQQEYVEFLKGTYPPDKEDIFSGIDTSWNRVVGGKAIGKILYDVEKNFDFTNPAKHLKELLQAYEKIKVLKNNHWRSIKLKEIKEIIQGALGLYIEGSATSSSTTPNNEFTVNFELLNRGDISVALESIELLPQKKKISKGITLSENNKKTFKETFVLNNTVPYSTPYWLDQPWGLGMYQVPNQKLIGDPETEKKTKVIYNFTIGGSLISFTKPIIYRYSKRDKGEIYEPFEVLPIVTTKLAEKVLIFSKDSPRKIKVQVRAGKNKSRGVVRLEAPKNWKVSPTELPFDIAQKNDIQTVEFLVTPTKKESEGKLKAKAIINDKVYDKELVEINHAHIPKQRVLLPSAAKVVRLNLKKEGNHIGYIQGSGDAVPDALRQIGYKVSEIDIQNITQESLEVFDAIVVGIRAYNTKPLLQFKQKYLLAYVEGGGNLIVQYNTYRRVDVKPPFPLTLSRDRVTDENAAVSFLAKDHNILNYPNKITQNDFDGWVQERGLYFPNTWSDEYTPILSMHDVGETSKKGSLLVAKYGKGNYIYTGLSFFRELPAGVPGAYKLFVNLLSSKSE